MLPIGLIVKDTKGAVIVFIALIIASIYYAVTKKDKDDG